MCGTMNCKGNNVQKNKKNKGWKWIVIVLLIMFIALSTVVGMLYLRKYNKKSDLSLNMASTNKIHRFDDSKYKIVNSDDANEVMNKLKKEIGYSEMDSFQNITEESIGKSIYYQMQQYYKGYPVWNAVVNLETDSRGNLICITENRKDILGELKEPTISEKEARNCIEKEYKEDSIDILNQGLYVFNKDGVDSCLVYSLFVYGCSDDGMLMSKEILVDANKNQILDERNKMKFAEEFVKMQGSLQSFDVPVEKNDDKISLKSQGLQGYKSKNKWMSEKWDITNEKLGIDDIATAIKEKNQKKISSDSIDAYGNAYQVLQYYRKHCPTVKKIDYATVTGAEEVHYTDDKGEVQKITYINNAFSSPWGDKHLLFFGPYSKSKNTLANSLDVVAHEMGHSVIESKNKLSAVGVQTGALNEAYSDIFSVCMGNSTMKKDDWIMESEEEIIRNISNPSQSNCPANIKGYIKEEGKEHENSTIISHAAYLMWKNGDKLSDYEILIDLWYRSLEYLNEESTFTDCENAVYEAGKRMYKERSIDEEDLQCIEDSFSEVGIHAELKKIDLADKREDENYTWVVEPTIEADAIYYLADYPDFNNSINELSKQADNSNAVIQRGNELGIIDIEGNLLTEVAYKEIANFGDSYMMIRTIPKYSEEYGMDWDMYWLTKDGKIEADVGNGDLDLTVYYYYNGNRQRTGNLSSDFVQEAIPVQQSSIYHSSDIVSVMNNLFGKYALEYNCDLITGFIYDECGSLSDGLFAVCQNGKWGYVDKNGKIVIPIEYDASWQQYPVFDMGSSRSTDNVKDYCYAASYGYVNLCQDDEWELRDIEGEEVIPSGIFEKILPVFKGKCWVKKDGKWGVIQLQNKDKENEGVANFEISPETYMNVYAPILQMVNDMYGQWNYYSIYDIDKDGVKELLVLEGTCTADYVYKIYTIENMKSKYLGQVPGANSTFCEDENGGTEKYIIRSAEHMDYVGEFYVSIENGKVVEREIKSNDNGEFYSYDYPIAYAEVTDLSSLK